MTLLLASTAVFFLLVQVATCALASWRCRPRALPPDLIRPGVTIVRPLCGLEAFSRDTLAAAFALDYPAFELLFCVAREDDPVVPLVEAAIRAHPRVPARLLIGDDIISINPKLNNMVKGWRAARYDWIVFIDSNVLTPPDFVTQLVATWRDDTGAISAPPVGCSAEGLWSHLECAFLNTFEARWQYVVDTFGLGFAQGKTLFYRRADLDRSGMRELASDPAEDAATTKMVRRHGLRVRLAPPSPLPIGRRDFVGVWGRQLRWARLRRMTFLLEFLPEILSGSVAPALCAACAAYQADLPVAPVLALYGTVWWGSEILLAAACRWPLGWQTLPALIIRDALIPLLWAGGLAGNSFTWKGTVMTARPSGTHEAST